MDLRDRIEAHKELITDRLDPDFGLLDKLLASRSLTRPEIADVKAVLHPYARSGKLLEYVLDRGIYEGFLDAVRDTQQTHLANFILSNGERRPEFGDDWPLTEREISIFDNNQHSLVDLLDTSDLLPRLYSHKVVNNRQRDFVSTKTTSHEKNEALLEILRRSSLQSYSETIYCLHLSKQNHIAGILKEGGEVVRVRSELETECDVNEVEDELITKFTEMLGDHSMRDSTRILECTQLRLIAAKRGHSIILYFLCKTSAELINLKEMQTSGKLANVVREMFNEILSRSQVIELRTTLYDEDFSKCELGFRNSAEANTEFENCAIVEGLDDGPTITNDVIKLNLRRPNEISTQEQIPTEMKNECFAAVYCNTMYVSGVGAKRDEIWKYKQISGWMKCASLVQGRRRHSAAFIDEVLYICGGFVDSTQSVLDSVEAYNAITGKCSTVGKLVHGIRSSGNCVPFRGSLYIFGGTDKDDNNVSHVQVYNKKLNTCTLISKSMPRPYRLMRAVLWETSVILLGWETCFIFNIETETWEEREQFKTDVVHFGLVLENGRVFVIGGGRNETDEDGKTTWICRDDVRHVPLQNILDDKPIEWKIHATLPKPSLVCAFANNELFF